MRRILFKILIFCGLLTSCYKPYNAGIEAGEKILVVEGMVTNEAVTYHVRLGYALPFGSEKARVPLLDAHVFVTDDQGNSFPFTEKSYGNYISDSLKFRAYPGRSYTLNIETPDGEIFISNPQRLEPEFSPDSIYAEVDYQTTISRFNQSVVTVLGANILADIKSKAGILPHFRFTSSLVKQYFYALYLTSGMFDPLLYSFYCWQTENAGSDINLTTKEYSTNASALSRHQVCFIDDLIFLNGLVYGLGAKRADLSYEAQYSGNRQTYALSHRILYLNQYTLNDESYVFYKSMDEQLRSEGKLFDPIASQLRGNITCPTNKNIKITGFFEASSINRTAYIIGLRNLHTNQYLITKIPYVFPSKPEGCMIDEVPPFWIK